MGFLRKHWPIVVCLALFFALTAVLIRQCLARTGGVFIYPLDDTYIHLSIARNVVLHGVWGVTRHGFGAASSSLLWPVLIAAAFKLTGVHSLKPLVLSTGCSALALVVIYIIARREKMPPAVTLAILLAVMLFTPLMTLAISGMEHAGQVLIDIAFLYGASRAAALAGRVSLGRMAILALLAALTTAVRYEGLFLVAFAMLAMLLRRRWKPVVVVGLFAAAPVVAFGMISMRRGGLFFPNSVALKGHMPHFLSWTALPDLLLTTCLNNLHLAPALFWLILASTALLVARRTGKRTKADTLDIMLALAITTAMIHCTFAAVGILFRYEAYLVALLCVPIGLALGRIKLRHWNGEAVLRLILSAAVGFVIIREPWLAPQHIIAGQMCQVLYGTIFLCAFFAISTACDFGQIRIRHIAFMMLFMSIGLFLSSPGLSVAAAVGVIDLIRRRWPRASFSAMAAFAPLAIGGLLFVGVLDRNVAGTSAWALHWRDNGPAALVVLCLATGFLMKPPADLGTIRSNVIRSAVGITGLVLLLALTAPSEPFFRFEPFFAAEEYFVLLLVASAMLALADFGQVARAIGLITTVSIVLYSLLMRGGDVWRRTPQACGNVYEQQYQMAHFIAEYYPHSVVAVNDIGMVSYLNDIDLLDVLGLNDADVARLRLDHTMDRATLADMARRKGVSIAIISPGWLSASGGVPPQWKEVGQWRIADNYVCAFDTVTFYAVDPTEAEPLAEHLRAYGLRLPRSVVPTPQLGTSPH